MLIARFRGNRIFPGEFPNDLYDVNTCTAVLEEYPTCPECGDRVTYVKESSNGRTAHFRRCSGEGGGGGGCDGSSVGEEDEHRAMKSIATSAAEACLSTITVEKSDLEVILDAPVSDSDYRKVDCLLEFAETDEQLGDGLIIEAQYRNKSKDIRGTTFDYLALESNYSVLWLSEEDFDTSADSPEDWTCQLGSESALRDKIRRQLWPSKTSTCVFGDGSPVSTAELGELGERNEPPKRSRAHANVYILEVAKTSEVSGASARFVNDIVDEWAREIKLETPWAALFDPPETERFIDEVADSSKTSGTDARFATDAVDWIAQQIKRAVPWEDLFDPGTGGVYIQETIDQFGLPKARVTVSLPAHIKGEIIAEMRAKGKIDGPGRPPNPFDDIQCWSCGTYWWAHGDDHHNTCPRCGIDVDVEWNLSTGRLSRVPEYLTRDQAPEGEMNG